jgi:hypothetical protein
MPQGQRAVRTRCKCGNVQLVQLSSILRGASKSCGCLQRERVREMWQDPSYVAAQRDRSRAIMHANWDDPSFAAEVSRRGSETLIRMWQDPTFSEMKRAEIRERATRHGLSEHSLYRTHHEMMQRCYSPRAKSYKNYGARGIRVYGPWHDRATGITGLAEILGPRPRGKTLDRIDNDGHYAPGNLRWSSPSEQTINQGHGIVLPIAAPACAAEQCVCG